MFPPHSERNTEKRLHLGQDKGAVLAKKRASTLSFHREEGALPPSAPNPPLLGPHVFVKMYLPPTGKISFIPGAFSNISLLRST